MRGSDTLGSLNDRSRPATIPEFRALRRCVDEAAFGCGARRSGRRNIGKPDYITGKYTIFQ
jgi:hypothetical protein